MSPGTAVTRSADGGVRLDHVEYQVELQRSPAGPKVIFTGTISSPDPARTLNPFLDGVHDRIIGDGAREVRVDLRDLEYCNSSGFKLFVYWIQKIRALPDMNRYRLRFLSSRERRWQRASLVALACFGATLVDVEVR